MWDLSRCYRRTGRTVSPLRDRRGSIAHRSEASVDIATSRILLDPHRARLGPPAEGLAEMGLPLRDDDLGKATTGQCRVEWRSVRRARRAEIMSASVATSGFAIGPVAHATNKAGDHRDAEADVGDARDPEANERRPRDTGGDRGDPQRRERVRNE